MSSKESEEFIIMLLIENRALLENDKERFLNYLKERYDLEDFNRRYSQLLDSFMNKYALNKTEKSEINL